MKIAVRTAMHDIIASLFYDCERKCFLQTAVGKKEKRTERERKREKDGKVKKRRGSW